ncbi:hypothetical protein GF326_05065 [Candidatus Bathyarchaeota archaeon]|nr:hypothetical protein [Candidatus Bathyarchaeota archaeon]
MSDVLKRNFETGRLLLLATILLSVTLISQLYVISESMDLSNGLQFTGIEISLTVSYLFTAISMLMVINEFFQIKTKMKGLLALTNVLNNMDQSDGVKQNKRVKNEPPRIEIELDELDEEIDEDLEFENLLKEELDESPEKEEGSEKYKKTKIKIEEDKQLEPLIEEVELQGIFDEIEEESETDRLLAESEVIKTLSELEEIVEQLKSKQAPAPTI